MNGTSNNRTVAIVQARMGSTRLAGKALLDICGSPMLAHVVRRAQAATLVDEVVVATTTSPSDDAIADLCASLSVRFTRGSEADVLSRYVDAARMTEAAIIVRITSDCPLLDPRLIDRVLATRAQHAADYASNTQAPRTFPHGLDVEVFTRATLDRAHLEDTRPEWREHVTPYIYCAEGRFSLARVDADDDFSDQRWTVDTAEDLRFVRRVMSELGTDCTDHVLVRTWIRNHPEHTEINASVQQRRVAP
jgi:spore coat polysaccharide biosynthesis protein SpsF